MRKFNLKRFLVDNIVTIIFLSLTIIGILIAKQPIHILVNDLVRRFSRNTLLVLSLIIPVLAGMGLNFGIVIGAMAAQVAVIFVADMGWNGPGALLMTMLISIPFSILFGWLIGKLLNKTRGQEMITSLMVSLFAQGLWLLVYLALMGRIIPIRNPDLLIPGGIGIRNTVNLGDGQGSGIKYALNNLWSMPFFLAMTVLLLILAGVSILRYLQSKRLGLTDQKYLVWLGTSVLGAIIMFIGHATLIYPESLLALNTVNVPMATVLLIILVAMFINWLMKTKLGQDFRSVGQSQAIAAVSGINVDRTRIIAMITSTVMAALGHIVLLENVGVLNTYGAHVSIGLYSVAALLVGGATVNRATVGQAFLGVILFHTLFYIAPFAGAILLNDAQNGEYFRNIIAYGAIGLSLVLYAWKQTSAAEAEPQAEEEGGPPAPNPETINQ
ncbi:MAG TPA: ABC transporter permease [Tissierellia bacterium]|nr:ABC transporter permease [Tissierellia bacterium]